MSDGSAAVATTAATFASQRLGMSREEAYCFLPATCFAAMA